jgi:hypothetical protein
MVKKINFYISVFILFESFKLFRQLSLPWLFAFSSHLLPFLVISTENCNFFSMKRKLKALMNTLNGFLSEHYKIIAKLEVQSRIQTMETPITISVLAKCLRAQAEQIVLQVQPHVLIFFLECMYGRYLGGKGNCECMSINLI